jgi:5,10-methylenetetrahydromethanopterin reductase
VRSIGEPLMPLGTFRRALGQIQALLSGETVAYGEGQHTRMAWLARYGLPKVPVSVSATGPKTIEIGAQVADRLTLSLGADLERIQWAISLARTTRASAGLDPDGLSIGAYVNCTVHPDPARARELVRPRLNTYIRHWTMHENARQTLESADDELVDRIKRREAELTDDFVERHAVAGPSDYVVERLRQLLALGLDHLIMVGYAGNVDPAALADGSQRFGTEVLPALRALSHPSDGSLG